MGLGHELKASAHVSHEQDLQRPDKMCKGCATVVFFCSLLNLPPLHPRFLERYAVTTAYPEFEEFVVKEVGVGVAGDELLGEQRADGGLHGAGGTKVMAGDITLGQNVFGMPIYSDSGKHCALPFR